MAGQRWSEPDRQRRRGHGGLGGLGLALSLFVMLLPACSDGGPTGTDRPDGNGATSGADGPTERLAGTWRNVVVIEVPGDIQTWTTTWRFEPDGGCLQTVETESLAEGFPRVTERPCSFVARDFDVAIAFTGGGTLVFAYSFADFNPDRLILDGFEYVRLA
jgi:hypothetical protein